MTPGDMVLGSTDLIRIIHSGFTVEIKRVLRSIFGVFGVEVGEAEVGGSHV